LAQQTHKSEAPGVIAAALIGAAAFFAWAGPKYLDPGNVGWLKYNDRAMHMLGWWFYRASPWGLPPGINPRNGLEISGSVALSDSLPLFALPFKLLSPFLPQVFQYWGIWLLVCVVLQGLFAYLLARELRLTTLTSLLFAAFLVIMPAFLLRMSMHMALSAHWVLLAALYLYVRQQPLRLFVWPLLLALVAAIHAYLLVMVLAIWAAALLQRFWLKRIGWSLAALEAMLALAATLVVLWAVGFFVTSSLGTSGFGFYRMNLLTLITPYNWSKIIPGLPVTEGDYEGLIFPGLGMLLLLVLALFATPALKVVAGRRWLPLLIVILLLLVFAASNKPVIGSVELGTVPLPQWVLNLASTFRASGRMVWPAGYLLCLTIFVAIDRRFGARKLLVLGALALGVQLADMSDGFTAFQRIPLPVAATWDTPLKSPFWNIAATHYAKVRAIPIEGLNHHWRELAYYAATHGLGTDVAYLGRIDAAGSSQLRDMATAALADGSFEPDALYLLDFRSAVLARHFMKPDDLLTRIDDNYIVLAPAGRHLPEIAALGLSDYVPEAPKLAAGETAVFGPDSPAQDYLLNGWATSPGLGARSFWSGAELDFAADPAIGGHRLLRVALRGLALGADNTQKIDLSVNGRAAGTATLTGSGPMNVDIPLPDDLADGNVIVGFTAPNIAAAAQGSSTHLVGIGIVSMTLITPPAPLP
jgi:hypothetical protein